MKKMNQVDTIVWSKQKNFGVVKALLFFSEARSNVIYSERKNEIFLVGEQLDELKLALQKQEQPS